MDILKHNRKAWNSKVEKANEWTKPVSVEEVDRAKKGDWKIILTPTKSVPISWYPELKGADVLCLASGGGQQGPILAAAGANVTVFDNSPRQLDQDQFVAKRDSLDITTIQGDMRDLSCFEDETFDFIVHPCSNHCVDDVTIVWKETYRVLKKKGSIISGFSNPILSLIDWNLSDEENILQIKYKLPYSDIEQLDKDDLQKVFDNNEPLDFGHTLEQLIGGQIAAGFVITGFFEDNWGGRELLDNHTSCFIATKANKL
jgi:SAM-dependent methyltransferase